MTNTTTAKGEKCNRKLKTAVKTKKKPAFFHERCWLCGGKFEQQSYALNTGDKRWVLNECKTCGLAIFMRQLDSNAAL
jgi:tRNA U54 and U55 pseudouridine synthase Pus10